MRTQHAYLSASSSHRWLHCTAAPALEAQFPSTTSTYAEAGTLAHSIAEFKAHNYFVESMSKRRYNAGLKKFAADAHYSPDMESATDEYLEYLKSLALSFPVTPFVALEIKVDFSEYVPNGFGTADCIMISGDTLCIIDYKNGQGVNVSAERNSQMMLYALGALAVFAPIYGDSIQNVQMSIVQPHAGGVKEWSCTRAELEQWGEDTVKPAAKVAFEGNGVYAPDADPNGRCKFCRARHQCRALIERMLSIGNQPIAQPELIDLEEFGEVLQIALGFSAWVDSLKDYALSQALNGQKIKGFKVVEGRSSRSWTDLDTAFTALEGQGIAQAMLWERKPCTVAGLEKALGEKQFAEVANGLVSVSRGKPTLVAETDKRPEYNPAEMAFSKVEVP